MINLSLYNSVMEAYVHRDDQVECSFPELVAFLTEMQKELTLKTDGMLFNCCKYKAGFESPNWIAAHETGNREDYIRRCKDNVESISCLLLDIDGTMTLEQAVEQWANYEFLIYSTHGHSKGKAKFRLVVPLERAITKDEFIERHKSMCNEFQVDGASFTISQAFYLPSYSSTNKDIAFIHWNESEERYNALQLEKEDINYNVLVVDEQTLTKTPLTTSILKTLQTGRDLHYSDALALAVVCKAHGITSSDYQQLVSTIAAVESELRSNRVSVAGLYKDAFSTHVTHKKVEQLMRKLGCNMWRWEILKP